MPKEVPVAVTQAIQAYAEADGAFDDALSNLSTARSTAEVATADVTMQEVAVEKAKADRLKQFDLLIAAIKAGFGE